MSEHARTTAALQSAGLVTVKRGPTLGMVTLRGNLADADMKDAVKKLTGVGVPDTGCIALKGKFGAAWMSPDELLILTPAARAKKSAATLSENLHGSHHLVVDVSDARATFTLHGQLLREVLAKLSPADLSPAGFGPRQIRRTRLAQVPVAFWFSARQKLTLVCFRSVGDYVHALLENAAAPDARIAFF